MTTRDNKDSIRVLLYSYYTTITGWGVLLTYIRDFGTVCLWHMLSARRQEECLKQLMEGSLPIKDTLRAFDWKEKIRLPFGPEETSDMWHAQQNYAISCFGCGVLTHTSKSTAAKADLQVTYLLFLNEVREQNAEASNKMVDEVLLECEVSNFKCTDYTSL